MDGNAMSPADIAALTNSNDNFNGNGSMWMTLFFFIIMMGGLAAFNNNGNNNGPVVVPTPAPQPSGVTQAELTAGLNNSSIQSQLQALQLATANNDLETVKSIGDQTNNFLTRDYANNINLLNGYNQINNSITDQTYQIGSKIDSLSHHMDQCCFEMQKQQLTERISDLQSIINQQAIQISNNQQTAQILGTTGRWVGWSPSGTADATKVVAA